MDEYWISSRRGSWYCWIGYSATGTCSIVSKCHTATLCAAASCVTHSDAGFWAHHLTPPQAGTPTLNLWSYKSCLKCTFISKIKLKLVEYVFLCNICKIPSMQPIVPLRVPKMTIFETSRTVDPNNSWHNTMMIIGIEFWMKWTS